MKRTSKDGVDGLPVRSRQTRSRARIVKTQAKDKPHQRATPRARAKRKPNRSKPEPPPPRQWKGRFLDALSRLGNVRAAAEIAGIDRSTANRARKAPGRAGDVFRVAWEEAIEEAVERLEQEAFRRGVTGWDAPYRDTVERKYSDRLLELLLKAHAPEKYSERRRLEGPGGGPVEVVDPRVDLADRLLAMVERKESAKAREAAQGAGVAPKGSRRVEPADEAGQAADDE